MDILLVEDHSDTAKVIARALRIDGHHVEVASSCAQALALFRGNYFDIVLCDIGLPDGFGYDLVRNMLKVRYVNAIALTGYGMASDIEQSKAAGFVAHRMKPIGICELRKVLDDVDRGGQDDWDRNSNTL